MKLAGPEAARYLARPDPARGGLLIYGADAMRVALKRQEAIAALIGPNGDAEMRLTRVSAGDLRRDPALLADATRAQGFFPGQRVAFVEDAGDGATAMIGAARVDWRAGDAGIVVTAGALAAKSSLRKLFETHPAAVAIGLYDDPPSRAEIEADLARAGLPNVPAEAMADLVALSRAIDPGDFRQTVEKIALYKRGDATPLISPPAPPRPLRQRWMTLSTLWRRGRWRPFPRFSNGLRGKGRHPSPCASWRCAISARCTVRRAIPAGRWQVWRAPDLPCSAHAATAWRGRHRVGGFTGWRRRLT